MSGVGVERNSDDFLSVTGSEVSMPVDGVSLTPSERDELNLYREVLGNLQNLSLGPSQSGGG
jgi:hypothetical protein